MVTHALHRNPGKRWLGPLAAVLLWPMLLPAQSPELDQLAGTYASEIRPLLEQYCHRCHSAKRTEAEIDLTAMATLEDVRKQPKTWIKVREMLDSRQMPPKGAKQPSDADRNQLSAWVRNYLVHEAKARAGDAGAIGLRKLSNAEYNYTIRDLTGLPSLDPTREFPIDAAAGEGFTNTASGLAMSPAMVRKYLEAAKGIAQHVVLLPDGIDFSPHLTRRDRTDDYLARIRNLYHEHTLANDAEGRLPLGRYLEATLAERDALRSGQKTVVRVATERGLNPKYLAILWQTLSAKQQSSFLLDRIRKRWNDAGPADAPALTAEIARWQKVLWKFNKIGSIERRGGPPSWQQAVVPVVTRQEFKVKLPTTNQAQEVVLYLESRSVDEGKDNAHVVWKRPRLSGGGRPELLLRDVSGWRKRLAAMRREKLAKTTTYLTAVAEAGRGSSVAQLAAKHQLDSKLLQAWLDYLEIGEQGPVEVKGLFRAKMLKSDQYDFIRGWGTGATPLVVANSSDQQVRIPGFARPHGVVAHPSPTLFAAMGWLSPIDGVVRVEARVADAHPDCGNGVEWVIQHRTQKSVANLWQGDFNVRGSASMPAKTIAVRKGELVTFILGPRQRTHFCDLTAVDLTITETTGAKRVWDLGKDVSDDILASNPHADRLGNKKVWHFYKGEMKDVQQKPSRPLGVPRGSLLDAWRSEKTDPRRKVLAVRVQQLATGEPPADKSSPDAVLYDHLQTLVVVGNPASSATELEPDPRFGKHPMGKAVDPPDLVVRTPGVVELRIPAEIAAGRELVVTGELDAAHSSVGSVRLHVSTEKSTPHDLSPGVPFLVGTRAKTRERLEKALADFRKVFPISLCYTRIIPVDEVVTLTLFYREDEHLQRLMLDEQQRVRLDRLWEEMLYVSQEPLAYLVAFEQIREFATQDNPAMVKALKPLVKPVHDRANAFRNRLLQTEPIHVQAVLEFADRAWRRTLTDTEQADLRRLYKTLRDSGIDHEKAIRLTLARVLTSPAFLYRLEKSPTGKEQTPISDGELATRLSYFLWSSLPDDVLRNAAEAGQLTQGSELVGQTRRMLKDPRTRRLAVEFACQWLHIRNFDQNDTKNEKLYPEFADLRGDMYEESVRFFEDLFRNNGSILELLNADHTFVNESLAKHYGLAGVHGPNWRRIDKVRAKGRGGILGMATVLASQSGASRTSPILRGNWVSETLLGEKLPKPPANVPQLPERVPTGSTARELIVQHSSDPACAKCHARIDPYGFALEQFDTIGRLRPKPRDTKTTLLDGKSIEGLAGLREYLSKDRRDDFVRQFCRKLLGYALGREVQLSDEVLLAEMQTKLEANDYRFAVAVETIVTSRQFREIRGREDNPLENKP